VSVVKKSWFSREEYEARVSRVQEFAKEQGLDFVLAFHPESVTYLTGFWTRAFQTFQFAIIPRSGNPITVLRDSELFHFERLAGFDDRILWTAGDVNRDVMVKALTEVGGANARFGVEFAGPLVVPLYEAVKDALPKAQFVDIGNTLAVMREIKSPAEIGFMRKGGRIAEIAMDAGIAATRVGGNELDVAAAIASAMVLAGSSSADPNPMASGDRAEQVHSTYEERVLELGDLVHLEVNPCVNYYYTRFFRPVIVGRATDEDQTLAATLLDIQDRALAEIGPGVPASVLQGVIRDGVKQAGLRLPPPLDHVEEYPNSPIYSVGLSLPPIQHTFTAAQKQPWMFKPGMTLHTWIMVRLPFSETILVTDSGYERLTNYRRELIVAG
jgi:Xaa-Pro dipeptidase